MARYLAALYWPRRRALGDLPASTCVVTPVC